MPSLVIIESPLAGDTEANLAYAKRCLLDSLARGEAPFASHLLYPQVLDDSIPEHRKLGMAAGLAWMIKADVVAVYADKGISSGMKDGIAAAEALRLPIEYRFIEETPYGFLDSP